MIQSIEDLDAVRFTATRLAAIWNALPGAITIRRFKSRDDGVSRIWTAFEDLIISSPRGNSKQAQMIELLNRPAGASIEDLVAATGWQRHSICGVLSGVLKKKLGLDLSSTRIGETRMYRIAQ